MEVSEYQKRTRFIITLGKALHHCGAASQRIEKHLGNVAAMLDLHGHFLFTPTGFTCVFWLDDEYDQHVHIERVEPGGMDLGRLWMIDSLIENISQGNIPFEEGNTRLQQLAQSPPLYASWLLGLSWIATGAAFAALLSNTWNDVIASAGLCLVTFLLYLLSKRYSRLGSLLTILAPFLSGVIAQALYAYGMPINVPFVILSSILVFIPGLSLTVAMSEISAHQLVSGSSRLVDAIMSLLLLLFGAIMGVSTASLLWSNDVTTAPLLLHPAKTWPAVIVLSLSLTIAFNIPYRKCLWGFFACIVAFAAAKSAGQVFGMITGMFLGSLAVGLFSNFFARLTKAPASVLSTQGIILLVPGSTTYMILNQWVIGTRMLPGAETSSQALMMFVSLVAGLLFANAMLPPRKSL